MSYSVDSIKRTVHLTFHGLFFYKKYCFFKKFKTVFLKETVRKKTKYLLQYKLLEFKNILNGEVLIHKQ